MSEVSIVKGMIEVATTTHRIVRLELVRNAIVWQPDPAAVGNFSLAASWVSLALAA